jgi:hypothetical protein
VVPKVKVNPMLIGAVPSSSTGALFQAAHCAEPPHVTAVWPALETQLKRVGALP